PYAAALAVELVKPGQSDLIMFHRVRVAVMDKTKGDQVPWTEDGIQRRERIQFGGEIRLITAPPGALAGAQTSEAAQSWAAIKDTTNIVALELFIGRYKDTFFAELARARIDELKKQQVVVVTPPKAPAPAPQAKPAMATSTAPPRPSCDGILVTVGQNERRC